MVTLRLAWLIPMTALAALPCHGQQADLAITHDDLDGVVSPGQTVTFDLRLEWTGAHQVLMLSGAVAATGNMGVVTDLTGPTPGSLLLTQLSSFGTPQGGSINNIDLEFLPLIFVGGLPSCVSYIPSLGSFLSWKWTAPATPIPTIIDFDFLPDPGTTGVWANPNPGTPIPAPLPTTFHGTSLVVIPAPAALGALVVGVFLTPRRRT